MLELLFKIRKSKLYVIKICGCLALAASISCCLVVYRNYNNHNDDGSVIKSLMLLCVEKHWTTLQAGSDHQESRSKHIPVSALQTAALG